MIMNFNENLEIPDAFSFFLGYCCSKAYYMHGSILMSPTDDLQPSEISLFYLLLTGRKRKHRQYWKYYIFLLLTIVDFLLAPPYRVAGKPLFGKFSRVLKVVSFSINKKK